VSQLPPRSPAAEQLDIGLVIKQPFKDPKWLGKVALMGLFLLVPILGGLNLSGWMRTISDRHLQDHPDKDILPEANFSYLGAGWRFFLAMLPLVAIVMGFFLVGGVGVAVAISSGNRDAESVAFGVVMLMYGALLIFSLLMQVVMPAIYVIHLIDDESWASIRFGRMFEVMKEGGTQYVLLFVSVLLAGVISSLGVFACYVGIFVTVPLGYVMIAKAVVEFARITRPKTAGFEVPGSVGGSSGSPFGVPNN
jgi:hypothetical protein